MDERSDGVAEALTEAGHRNAMVLTRTLEPLARTLADVARRRAETASQDATEQTRAYEAQRAAARAFVEPVRRESWWAGADERAVLDMHQVAAAWAPHDDQAAQSAELIRTQARERYGVDRVEHLADRVQARGQVAAEISSPAREAAQLRQRAAVCEADATRLGAAASWTAREPAQAGSPGAQFYQDQAGRARTEAAQLRAQADDLEDPARQAERLRTLGRDADAEAIELLQAAAAVDMYPGQDEPAVAAELRAQASARQEQASAYRDRATALDAEAAPSADLERQAMIAQSVDGIAEPDAVAARTTAAAANAHPARAAATAPAKAPKARKARAQNTAQRQVTVGR